MSVLQPEQPAWEEMNEVIKLYSQNKTTRQVAKELGMRHVDVVAYIEDWKRSHVGQEIMRDRVEELIATMDQHYSGLIAKAYEIIDEVDELRTSGKETMTRSQMLSQKKGALDLIAKLEKDRIDVLQKFGVFDASPIGDELAAMEEQKALILEVLEEELCMSCKVKVKTRLAGKMGRGPASEGFVVISSE